MIKSIVTDANKTKLFCVGDDWQSINSFAGAEVAFFTDFDSYFSYPEKTVLDKTYRCSKIIVDASNALMSHNKDRIPKNIIPYSNNKGFIHVLDRAPQYLNQQKYITKQCEAISRKINEIIRKENLKSAKESILVLSRFKKIEPPILDSLKKRCRTLKYHWCGRFCITDGCEKCEILSTVHSSKGQEAKHVILIDITSGIYGFPSEIEDNSVFDVVKAKAVKANKFEEERRLFYVALTRAKESVYICTQNERESLFLDEINDFITR